MSLVPDILKIKHKTEIFENAEIIFFNDQFLNYKNITYEILNNLKTTGIHGVCFLYAGHQNNIDNKEKTFTMLGDGRTVNILYDKNLNALENKTIINKNNTDIQNISIKGIGKTSLARDVLYADGYMTSDEAVKEYINTESLENLNIETERIIAIIKTNKKIKRYNTYKKLETLHDGAIIIKISTSPIRIGTLEYLAHNNNIKELKEILLEINGDINKSINIIKKAIYKNINLAHDKGFTHNMLNTDNINIFGQIIDTSDGVFYTSSDLKDKKTHNKYKTEIEKDNKDILFAFESLDSIKNIIS